VTTSLSGPPEPYGGGGGGANLADILERVLDRGIVIAGDIRINLLDIELLTIKLRLVIASVDKAREMGIDWWETDPALSSAARRRELEDGGERAAARELEPAGERESADEVESADDAASADEAASAEEPQSGGKSK
jgi:Gas vesicle protein